jgi:hypothetical protein
VSNKETLSTPATDSLNIEGLANKPACPVCQSLLDDVAATYLYKRLNPDTRWFFCPSCEGHLGFHRIKASWRIDPRDLETSDAFREYFGITELEEN